MPPILQLALDFLDLPRALAVADEAMRGGVDWLEAGTPLIKSEGLEAVRELKRRFPAATIVADLKTMDAGRFEMESAAKAGASIAGVLGAASDATISECIEVGRNYGLQVIVDMIEVADPVLRARQAEELGADFIGIHTAIDQQMRGEAPLDLIQRVAAAVSVPLAVAGGINSETAAEAARAGAGIIIVGGAIIKAADAEAAARQIRRAIDTGQGQATKLYKRATLKTIGTALAQVSTANISDARHRQGDLPGLRPVFPGIRMAGRAVTVRTYPGDWAKPVEAIDVAGPGDVLVIDAGGAPPAVWGELATHSARERGLAGVVIYGAVRDTPEIRELKFPLFSSIVTPTAGEPKGFGEINVPVTVAGQQVRPGDWIAGDDDGVVVLPAARAVEIANRAMDVMERENRLRREIEDGSTLSQVAYLEKWEKT
ncbi:MAG: orotidine 5'-phosphate decarboxylase [Actinomycetota bacterium]|nr:orotidine 5'-phosphate decarboxylase [Actinomycetota bacterium]MCL6092255.1 orotidine 5'-phosphate decarboxylase [Actinomycetota bacterium]MDA8167588.1 orotidine 5'-phosphate decarboxylase [Actinomycetota bacterium]